jgi:DNA polymerase-1
VKAVMAQMKEIMEGIVELTVPLKVDVGFGKNWAEIH